MKIEIQQPGHITLDTLSLCGRVVVVLRNEYPLSGQSSAEQADQDDAGIFRGQEYVFITAIE